MRHVRCERNDLWGSKGDKDNVFNIGADKEMRELVRETIKGQVLVLVKDDVRREVEEGLRRARGPGNTDLYPFIMQVCSRVATEKINDALKSFGVAAEARKIIDAKISALVGEEIERLVKERVKSALEKIDVQAAVKKQVERIKISI